GSAAGLDDMYDFLALVIDGGGDRQGTDAGNLQGAGVAGLAAGGSVKNRAVENDAAAVVDGNDTGRAVAELGIGAKQLFRHVSFGPPRRPPAGCCGAVRARSAPAGS